MGKIYRVVITAILVIVVAVSLSIKFNSWQKKHEQTNIISEIQTEIFAEEKTEEIEAKVIVYYFHTTFRCVSCHKIEQYTEESIKEYFGKQIESNELAYKVVNIEEKENEHFINDYQLYTKSVILSLVKDGKEVKYKNLDKVWQHLNNKDKFFEYIKEETQEFLDEINIEEKQ